MQSAAAIRKVAFAQPAAAYPNSIRTSISSFPFPLVTEAVRSFPAYPSPLDIPVFGSISVR